MGTFLRKGQSYDDWREENRREAEAHRQKQRQLREEKKAREAAEREANKKPLEVEIGERIEKLKEMVPEIQPGQITEPRDTLLVIKELLSIVDFIYQQQNGSRKANSNE